MDEARLTWLFCYTKFDNSLPFAYANVARLSSAPSCARVVEIPRITSPLMGPAGVRKGVEGRSRVTSRRFARRGHVTGSLPGVQRRPLMDSLVPMSESPLRIVVAKPGLDGHDRGAKVVARALRDAGMEVVYTGLHQTPEQIVEAAIQEDADGVGLSVLSGAHMTLFAKVAALLAERDAKDIVVFGGGIIPDTDIPDLAKLGVAKVFTPGATTTEIVEWVRANVSAS